MLNEANEVDRSVLIPNGAAIAEKVGQMRTNALAARATAESETAAKVDAVRMLTLVVSLAALVLGTLTAFFIGRGISRPVITMTKALGALAGGDQPVEIPAQARPDETIGRAACRERECQAV